MSWDSFFTSLFQLLEASLPVVGTMAGAMLGFLANSRAAKESRAWERERLKQEVELEARRELVSAAAECISGASSVLNQLEIFEPTIERRSALLAANERFIEGYARFCANADDELLSDAENLDDEIRSLVAEAINESEPRIHTATLVHRLRALTASLVRWRIEHPEAYVVRQSG